LWEGRQRERKLIARELFWWLTGRKYELGKVVERGGEKRFRVINLKVFHLRSCDACSERGGKEGVQKRKFGNQRAKSMFLVGLLLEVT
jgi:hypothetical protein